MANKKFEKGNFQDDAEVKEYNKGKRAGKNSRNKSRKGGRFQNRGGSSGNRHIGKTERIDAGYPASVNMATGGPVVARGDVNDPAWHAPTEQLLQDAADIKFNYPVGTDITLRYKTNYSPSAIIGDYVKTVPGIMAIRYMPTIGKSKKASDPFNQAMFQEYNWLRQANSGTSYYQAADLGVMQICQISAYSLLCELTRVYGLLSNFSPVDRYTPQALVKACGFSYDSLASNKTRFRDTINLFSDSLQKICLPLDIKYMDRQLSLLNHIYTDSESTKSQYYVMYMLYYWKFVEAQPANNIPSSAILTELTGTGAGGLITLEDIQNFIPSLINPLINSTVGQKISADILKAFGAANVYKVQQIAETYTVTPVYSKEILSMIENMTIVGGFGAGTGTISQDLTDLNAGSFITASYQAMRSVGLFTLKDLQAQNTAEAIYNRINWILNMHEENPSAGAIMEATRMTNIAYASITEDADKNFYYIELDDVSAEVALTAIMYFIENDGSTTSVSVQTEYPMYLLQGSASSWTSATINGRALRDLADSLERLSAFDWHPQVYVNYIAMGSYDDATYLSISNNLPMMDFDNYTIINADELSVMNETSLRGLFKVRSMPNT